MKRSLLLLTLIILSISLTAQIYTSEIEVTNATNGKVGIGTLSPNTLLHLNPSLGNPGFQIGLGTQVLSSQFYLKNNDPLGWGRHITFEYDASHYGHLLYDNQGFKWRIMNAADAFFFRNTANSTIMYLNDEGKLGIGTSSPVRVLDVIGDGDIITVDGINVTGISMFRNSTGQGIDLGTFTTDGSAIIKTSYAGTDLVLGTRISGNNYERMRITANGNVGIGTAAPSSILHVSGGPSSAILKIEADTDNVTESDNARIELWQDGGLIKAYIGFNETVGGTANMLRLGGQGIWDAITVNLGNGRVGISHNTPAYELDVSGTTRVTTLIESSDERLKTNIRNLSSHQKLKDIQGFEYNHKSDLSMHYGIIAQQVEEIYPHMVYTDSLGMKSVAYLEFIPLLIEAYKNQERELQELKAQTGELDAIKQELAALREEINQLKNK